MLVDGVQIPEIAERLGIGAETARDRKKRAQDKMGVRSPVQIALLVAAYDKY